ncbi:DNA adenine methylase [Mycobacteroides abscessus]|uniref:DNA adenine methylase n=1 Tax=Mycobacteroides abscessus TaxID=36809 RepID=UPI000E698782|nr:DNA adenine methylase [Mycobacteroides abscessus]MBN7350736.1 DNA adenine methylase [Mycobacteroides abscessus subsp. abscessus]QSM01922.1 DNA adenine methylase [Mycobacterium phage prophiGD11-3]RIR00154.1 DNA adenine methylase [Mycobacteroides abscessus]
MTELSAPFPYFGGKRRAAPKIWDALGDVGGYVEPFAGSAAALLARPRFTGRRVETLNDSDGWLVNTWRAIQFAPTDVAVHAAGPVTEIDYHARLAWLQDRRTPDLVAWLEGDPEHYDAKAAGWWLYVMACGIGDPWNVGPWLVVDGHLRKQERAAAPGITRTVPSPMNAGKGVNRELPHLGTAGQGVNRELPALGNAGQGVNADHGEAVSAYLEALAARLARVRIVCGDWRRVVTPSVIRSTAGNSHIGVLLDPPYAVSGDLYATTNTDSQAAQTISAAVRQWCLTADAAYRIVLCGFDTEHDALLEHGWTVDVGRAGGGAGYNTDAKAGRRERLWFSPACLHADTMLDFGAGV